MDVQQEAALSSPTQELPGDEILVAGRWRRGRGHPFQLLDPTAGCELMVLHTASVDDVDEAAVMGARAAADPVWRNLLPYERARYLHRIADLIERDTRRLSALQTANTGKTRAETTGMVRSSVATFCAAEAIGEFHVVIAPIKPRGS